jgi:cyanate permease
LLALDGLLGFAGWQWLLIIEGLPATILGFVCLFVLSDGPEKAPWLTGEERTWLTGVLANERREIEQHHSATLMSALTDWRVLMFAFVNFCAIIGSVGIGLWMPQILKGLGFSVVQVGFVAAVPYICGGVAMMYWARLSDQAADRSWFPVAGLLLGAVALLVCSYATGSVVLAVLALAGAVTGIMCYQSTFWPLPQGLLTGRAAAGGLALIVSIGNLGGFVGPYLIGEIRQSTGSFALALLAVAGFLLLGAALLRYVGSVIQRQRRAQLAGTASPA